jgi:hypothetical protein
MKAILVGRDEIELEGELQPPKEFAMAKDVGVYAIHERPGSTQRAMKIDRGVGIWEQDGALVHYDPKAVDMAWAPDGSLWSLVPAFEPGRDVVRHHVLQLDPASFAVLKTIVIEVPWGGPEYLEISPKGGFAIATWLEQSEWGYVGVDLNVGRQTPLALRWRRGPRAAPPKFLADGSAIVACHFEGAAWWNNREADDPSEQPSEGGPHRVGWITTHDVATNTVRETEVFVTLPPGWIPDDPYNSLWYQMWGPELDSPDSVSVWMPDGKRETFEMPLDPQVMVHRPLDVVRE